MGCSGPQWWRQVKSIPGPLWIVFILHMLDAYCFFSIAFNITLYFTSELGMSDSEASNYFGLWGGLLVLFGIPSGYIIDQIGLKKSILIGAITSTIARFVFAFSDSAEVSVIALLLGSTFGAGLFQSPLHIAVARYSPTEQVRNIGFSFLYTFANIGAIAALLSTDLFLRLNLVMSGYQLLFVVCAFVSLLTVVFGSAFQEMPERDQPAGTLSTKQFLATLLEKNLWMLMLLVIVLIPSRALFHYAEALVPIYLARMFPGTPYGSVLTVNPAAILVLTPIAGILLKRAGTYPMLISGTAIAGASIFIMYFWYTANYYWGVLIPEGVVVSELIFTVGEAIYSPRFSKYAIDLAPPQKQGIYGGLVPLPGFAGTLMAGWVSGQLLERYCSSPDAAECRKVWPPIGYMAMATPLALLLIWLFIAGCGVTFNTEPNYVAAVDKENEVELDNVEPEALYDSSLSDVALEAVDEASSYDSDAAYV